MNQRKIAALAAIIAFTTPSMASAQAVPDIEGSIIQGGQIDEIIRDQERLDDQLTTDGDEIDGEAGIYVLRVNEIFFIEATAGLGYSENPSRNLNNNGDSFLVNFGATAGVQTRLDEAVDFGLRVNLSGVEYGDELAPSSRNVNGTLTVGTPIGGTPLYASATAFGGFNFDGGFENGTAFYGGSISLSAGFPLGQRTIIRPGIGASRQWSEIEENDATSASASVNLVHVVTPKLSLGANVRVTRTWFDNFFEDVIFVERRDWSYGGGVSANWRENDWLSLSLSAGYDRRDSSFFLTEYESFEGSLLFSAIMRF